MAIREALLVLAVIVAIAALGLAMGRDDEPPKKEAAALPPNHPPIAKPREAMSPSFRPREALPLRASGFLDIDPHVPVDQYGARIQAWWSEFRAGDARHAYDLAYLLNDCRLVREFARSTREDAVASELSPRLKQCEGVGEDLIAQRHRLLEVAAAGGDVRAQTEFGLWPPMPAEGAALRDWESKALEYWQSAAERGSAAAMGQLAASYRDGTLGVAADGAMALGYYLSFSALSPRGRDPVARRVYESRVSIEERERAFELHRGLMARCCEAAP